MTQNKSIGTDTHTDTHLGNVRPIATKFGMVTRVRSLRIYAYFMVAIIRTIFIMILHALSHKMFFVVLDV